MELALIMFLCVNGYHARFILVRFNNFHLVNSREHALFSGYRIQQRLPIIDT